MACLNNDLCARFPVPCQLLYLLTAENTALNELVQDHALVIESLNNWQVSDHPRAAERIDEYCRFKQEIELEIKQLLMNAVKDASF